MFSTTQRTMKTEVDDLRFFCYHWNILKKQQGKKKTMKKLVLFAAILGIFAAFAADPVITTNDGVYVTRNFGSIRSKEKVVTALTPAVLARGANTFKEEDFEDDYWSNAPSGLFGVGVQRVETDDGTERVKIPALNRDGTVQTTSGGKTNYVGSAYLLDQDGIEYLSIHGGTSKTLYAYHRNGYNYNIANMPYVYGSNSEGTNGLGQLSGVPVILPPTGADKEMKSKDNGNASILVDREWLIAFMKAWSKVTMTPAEFEATLQYATNNIDRTSL